MELDQIWDCLRRSLSNTKAQANHLAQAGQNAYLRGVTISFYASNEVFAHIEKFQRLNGNRLIEWGRSDDDRLPSHSGGLDHRFYDSGYRGRVKCVLDPGWKRTNLMDLRHHVAIPTVDAVRRSEFFCNGQPFFVEVDRYDRRCSSFLCGHDRAHSHCATARNREGIAFL